MDWLARAGAVGAVCLAMTAAFAVLMTGDAVVAAAKSSKPDISAVSPTSGPAAGGTEVQITGRQLLAGGGSCLLLQELGGGRDLQTLPRCAQLIVYFGGEPGLVFAASPTHIDAFSPPHAAGTVDVTVTTPAGASATQPADRFTYLGSPPPPGNGSPPTVSKLAPVEGPTSGFTAVLITGRGLLPEGAGGCVECAGVSARFGASAVPVLEGTADQLLVASPPHEAGTVDVTVRVDGLVSAVMSTDRFTYAGRGHRRHRRHHRHHRHKHQRHGYNQHRGRPGHSSRGGPRRPWPLRGPERTTAATRALVG